MTTLITPPPPHLLKKFSTEAHDESNKRNGAGYLETFARLCIEWANSKSTPNSSQIRSSDITPPPELIGHWIQEWINTYGLGKEEGIDYVVTKAAQWGADHELEACCMWIRWREKSFLADELGAARRPKPPSLKKQAYDALDTYIYGEPDPKDKERTYNTIRCALESLDD